MFLFSSPSGRIRVTHHHSHFTSGLGWNPGSTHARQSGLSSFFATSRSQWQLLPYTHRRKGVWSLLVWWVGLGVSYLLCMAHLELLQGGDAPSVNVCFFPPFSLGLHLDLLRKATWRVKCVRFSPSHCKVGLSLLIEFLLTIFSNLFWFKLWEIFHTRWFFFFKTFPTWYIP